MDSFIQNYFPSFLVLLIAGVMLFAAWPHFKIFPQKPMPKKENDSTKKNIAMRVAMRDRH